ncbi:MAG: class I SAM-dependent methyltransferase [SAR324 cluster bacterium]|nr:class I SAM-dependent methyltransferase [SAR324 cluster bacterium]
MKNLLTNTTSLLYSEQGMSQVTESVSGLSWIQRTARNLLFRKVQKLQHGKLMIVDQEGQTSFGKHNKYSDLQATIYVHDPRFYGSTLLGGSIGAAESYIRGEWTCTDLTQVVRIIALNDDQSERLESGSASIAMSLYHLSHALRINTKKGSKKNISAHYDLSNEFFQLFLDQKMMYSSAIFENKNDSLEKASLAKLERICRKLDLKASDHLLEIGTGWGGMAIYAAKHYGCRVTTTTISTKQYELAVQRIKEEGLSHRITVLCQDYRTLEGQYDKLVSIEMIEAVGHQYYNDFFKICSERLKPEGIMLLQSITTDDQKYDKTVNEVDFIQKYIFPGGCLPSLTEIMKATKTSTNMRLFHLEDIGNHYAETLRHWRKNFSAKISQVLQLGFSEEFIRTWNYYFCYCEGLFEERRISTAQMVFTKPFSRRDPIVSVLP